MKVGVFSTKPHDREFLKSANTEFGHEITFLESRLTRETTALAENFPCVCAFVNDNLDAGVLLQLSHQGTELIALRSAGFNHVDLDAARNLDMTIVRVPAYSPEAVAEHTVGLIMALNRKIHRAYARVREGNFSLEGLLGFNLHEQTVGIIGTGKIGVQVAKILHGFGCELLAYDPYHNDDIARFETSYVDLDTLFTHSDILTLHCPLTPETHHIVDHQSLGKVKQGVMIINTSRGALIDTKAVVDALKTGRIASLGLDVYEEEAGLFFEDFSNQVILDDLFARLLTFPNVIITGHQGFFTRSALENIAETTLANISEFEETGGCGNAILIDQFKQPS